MRLAWWGMILIGIILVGAGAYTTLASQNRINYVKSCSEMVACGTPRGNPTPTLHLSSSLTTSLEEAQLGWIAGILMITLGLIGIIYGMFVRPQKPEPSP